MSKSVALIGFGEAGSTFALAARWGAKASAFDILETRSQAMGDVGVTACACAADALQDAPVVLSLVTADSAAEAASSNAAALAAGAIWCDMNSVAPDTKRAAAKAVETAGGRYADVAVLAPVEPARLNVPLLVSGAHAGDAAQMLAQLGFTNIRIVGGEVGRASAIKMIRSVMIKGIEALTDEMMAAAQAAGVAEQVLASLDASEKRIGWAERAEYNLERMRVHGLRRAAEMEEAAKTLRALGVEPLMTNGTVLRQRDAAKVNNTTKDVA